MSPLLCARSLSPSPHSIQFPFSLSLFIPSSSPSGLRSCHTFYPATSPPLCLATSPLTRSHLRRDLTFVPTKGLPAALVYTFSYCSPFLACILVAFPSNSPLAESCVSSYIPSSLVVSLLTLYFGQPLIDSSGKHVLLEYHTFPSFSLPFACYRLQTLVFQVFDVSQSLEPLNRAESNPQKIVLLLFSLSHLASYHPCFIIRSPTPFHLSDRCVACLILD